MLIGAFRDTLTLLNLRYQIIRDTKSKISLWCFIIIIAIGVIAASYAGQFIQIVAGSNQPSMEAAKIYASIYLNSYLNGELGAIVATTLGLAIVSVMIAPFTGASATSLISHHQLVSVQASTRHRFTDSIIVQFVSSISLLQLLTLTSVASMLTLDGGRKEGILYAWASWPVLVILSTAFVWIAEYLYRRFGEKKRLLMLGIVLGVIGFIVYNNQEEASTVFGIGTVYAGIIQGLHSFSLITRILAFVLLIGLWFAFAFIAYKISQVALSYPDLFAKKAVVEKKIRRSKPSSFPFVELCKLALMQVWRNPEIKKPIIMSTIFSAIAMYALTSNESLISTVIFIIPLMISLSWGSNVFGIIGNGLPWILSKPFVSKNILSVFAGLQLIMILIMTTITVIPVIIMGKLSGDSIASFILAVIGCSVIMTRSAIHKSVMNPFPYRSGYRGEPILPPATMIAYTMRFSLWAGTFGLLIFTLEDLIAQVGVVFVAIVWSLFRFARLNNKFKTDPQIRNKIIFTVSNN